MLLHDHRSYVYCYVIGMLKILPHLKLQLSLFLSSNKLKSHESAVMGGCMFWISVLCTLSLLIFGLQTYISKVKHQTSHGNIFPLYFEDREGPLKCSTLSFWYRFDLITTRYHHNRGRQARFFSS